MGTDVASDLVPFFCLFRPLSRSWKNDDDDDDDDDIKQEDDFTVVGDRNISLRGMGKLNHEIQVVYKTA